MRDTHEPHDHFVERLQGQVRAEVQRRNRTAAVVRDTRRPRWRVALAALALTVVSMGAGGAAVVAAYQAQTNEQRAMLSDTYARRIDLAQQRLAIEKQKMARVEALVSKGLASQTQVMEARVKVIELESEIQSLTLALQEVQQTGREPSGQVLSPVVGGRDFVTERWRADAQAPTTALELERLRLAEAARKVEVGVGDPLEVAALRAHVSELQDLIAAINQKLVIRQRYLKKEIDAAEADLRVQESEVLLRQQTLLPKIDLAKQTVAQLSRQFAVGLVAQVDVAEAQLRVAELDAEMAKAALDLALVRKQIAQRKGR